MLGPVGGLVRALTGRGRRDRDLTDPVQLANDDPMLVPVERGGKDITAEVEAEAEKAAESYDKKAKAARNSVNGGAYQALPGWCYPCRKGGRICRTCR